MKIINKIIIVPLLCFIFLFAGCRSTEYTGKNPELYTVAINSMLWTLGHSYEADFVCSSETKILEVDSYGRTLFSYTEKYYSGAEISFLSLIISQKSDENFVYYYPDYNFISIEKEIYDTEEDIHFSFEDIAKLKTLNDWDKEINEEKCIKKEITTNKKQVEINDDKLNEIFAAIEGYESVRDFDYLTDDSYGRFICYGRIKVQGELKYIVVLLNSDLTYNKNTCFYIPTDFYNYQDDLKEFKNLNNWNKDE